MPTPDTGENGYACQPSWRAVSDAMLPPKGARWVPLTRYQWHRLYERFAAFQQTCPAQVLADQIRGFFGTLTPHMERSAYQALKVKFKGQVEWDEIPRRPIRRNEARLQAGLLDSEEDRGRLERALRSPRERALIGLAYSLRRAEITRARWGDVVLARGIIYVPQGKGGKSSWTILTPDALAALRALWEAEGRPGSGRLILPSRRAWAARRAVPERSINPQALGEWISDILKRAGLSVPGRGAHAFRRTLATIYLRRNPGDLRGLQKILRHENLATTVLYDFPRPDDLMPRLARAFGEPGRDNGELERAGELVEALPVERSAP